MLLQFRMGALAPTVPRLPHPFEPNIRLTAHKRAFQSHLTGFRLIYRVLRMRIRGTVTPSTGADTMRSTGR